MSAGHAGASTGAQADAGAGLVLAVDTSVGVAVGLARGAQVLTTQTATGPSRHVESLMPLVRDVCAEASVALPDVGMVVVGVGPGPFTGLRVGVVTAVVLGSALGVPVRGVCGLDVLAADRCLTGPEPSGDFICAIDARRKELYWARYSAAGQRLEGPVVTRPDRLPDLPVAGPGGRLYPDDVRAVDGPQTVDAGLMAVLADRLPDEGLAPLYLRRPDVSEPSRTKSVLTTGATRLRRRRGAS